MVFNEESVIKLKKLVKNLEKIRGRHTELISLYIPAGYNVVEIQNMLRSEFALTQNVKSRQTRNNVLDALEKVMNHLKLFKKTPENGLITFCGNVSGKEGQVDLQIWSVEPPQPLNQKLYWCDQKFVLEPLKDMLTEKEVYGLIVIDG
ncbi:MAG: peptide chain release factor 1, partial [Chloroflexi bacterium CG08_land_8_20_14_0_20_45_12]